MSREPIHTNKILQDRWDRGGKDVGAHASTLVVVYPVHIDRVILVDFKMKLL